MVIAYELKIPLEQVCEMDQTTMGWWLAFFKHKNELMRKHSRAGK